MGNLPTARTETCIAGASVSHNLINEIQDVLIARNTFSRTFYPPIIVSVPAGITTGAANPAGAAKAGVFKFTAAGSTHFGIPFNPGEKITGFSYSAYGDGVTDVDGLVAYCSDITTDAIILASWTDTNRAAAWGAPAIGTFTPQVLAAGGILFAVLTVSTFSTAYYASPFSASFKAA